MLTAAYIILLVLILFGLTIFVHELGHYLVARWCGLKVEAFSIGFGPAILQKTVNGIRYKIGLLPFGGYVALPQLDPTLGLQADGEDASQKELPRVSPPRKIAVAIAGVTMNMILAFVLAWVIYLRGMPASPEDFSSVVGYVDPEGMLYAQGMRIGDEILSVDNERVENWKEFMMLTALKDHAQIVVRSPEGDERTIAAESRPSEYGNMRLIEGVSGRDFCKVLYPIPGSSAEAAGVQPDDLIVSLNGIELQSRMHMISLVDAYRDQTVPMEVERKGDLLKLEVTPAFDEESGRALIGIRFNDLYKDRSYLIHPRPWEQVSDHAWMIFRVLKALVTPGEAGNAAGSIGGPLAILYMFWLTIKSDLMTALWLTGLINVNLAILNLLPLPILDGGHIVFALYEWVRKKPFPAKLIYIMSNIFFVLFLGVALLLSYRDVFKFILPTHRLTRDAPPVEESNAAVTNQVDGLDSGELP